MIGEAVGSGEGSRGGCHEEVWRGASVAQGGDGNGGGGGESITAMKRAGEQRAGKVERSTVAVIGGLRGRPCWHVVGSGGGMLRGGHEAEGERWWR